MPEALNSQLSDAQPW